MVEIIILDVDFKPFSDKRKSLKPLYINDFSGWYG